jgi:hypothetical protein
VTTGMFGCPAVSFVMDAMKIPGSLRLLRSAENVG